MLQLRTFSSKCTPQALEYLDNHVNEWLKEHSDISIKFTNQSFGVTEGKGGQKEPQLFVNLWYEKAE
jgi:hypothetical protein